MTKRTSGVGVLCVAMASVCGTAFGESRVGIRDVYLNGLEAPSVWVAAKEATTPLLEVVVEKDLSCPGLFEGKEKPYRIDTPENRRKLMDAIKKNECEIIAFCTVVPFSKDSNDAENAAWIGRVAHAAAEMKVPVIMMPLGAGGIEQDEFLKRAVTFVKAVAPFARANKVQLTVENLGPYLNREEVLKPIMEAVPNDEVGSALDITNMYWFGYPPARIYELARNFAPHVRYVHAKNIKYPPEDRERQRDMGWEYGKYAEPIATGDIDWDKILEIYFAAGFKGDVVIEDDSLPKFDAAGKKRTIKEGAAYLRELIDKNSQPAGAPRVQFETSLGSFVVELDPDKAPQTVENFLRYVDEKFYDGTIFHRIMSDFMIQGGGFTGLNQYKSQGLNPPIQNEAKQGLKNVRGTIAMARTGAPHSATSQFFINVKDNAMLDHPSFDGWGYCAFGRVVEGMDVIDRIKAVQVRPNPANPNEQSEPIDPPVIKQVTRVR
ncbi:MAG: TIM barrel protein [Phycisphaerae bacterium]|nr:TIM barrel protein [Phycisphaerae bacterium]